MKTAVGIAAGVVLAFIIVRQLKRIPGADQILA